MNLVVLSGSVGRGWHVDDLARAAAWQGHELTGRPWRCLTGQVDAESRVSLGPDGDALPDIVMPRTMPAGSLEQIVFRMDALAALAKQGVTVVNPPRSVEVAVDKYLALHRMAAAGLPTPRTVVCQDFEQAMAAWRNLGGDALVKPLFGSEGFGIARLREEAVAERTFAHLLRMQAVLYIQQFIEHGGRDLRLMVIGDQVRFAMRRVGVDWRTNVARGGRGEPVTVTPPWEQLAIAAAHACDLVLAGVDILVDREGQPWLLEVNASPGWRELARVCGQDVAAAVIEEAVRQRERHGATG